MSWTSTRRNRDLTLRVGNPIYVATMVAIAAWAAWPIYQSWQFLFVVGASVVAGFGVALLASLRNWSLLIRALIGVAVFVVFCVPVAVPTGLTGAPQFLQAEFEALRAVIDGWRQLATISIPVGSYQATLAPAFVVFLFGCLFALSFGMRTSRSYLLTLPVVFLMLVFGLAFGSSDPSSSVSFGGFSMRFPREFLMGAIAFLVTISWLGWRSWRARTDALRRAETGSGVRNLSSARSTVVRRFVLGVIMIVVAVTVAGFVTPNLAAGHTRDVLRVAPPPTTSTDVTPLTLYRSFYNDDFTTSLFTVDSGGASVARVELATLDSYNGRVFSASDSFARVPYELASRVGGHHATTTISIQGYRYQWLPMVGVLSSVQFAGPHADALSDGFFYSTTAQTAVDTYPAGLQSGDRYTVDSESRAPSEAVADLTPPAKGSAQLFSDSVIPASVSTWVKNQNEPYNGAGLQVLINRLRARGYLSHSLTKPSTKAVNWMTKLPLPYAFQSSSAGQSEGRMDEMFTALNTKQDQVGGTANAPLVAAVGDDEQFAAAGALIAEKLGFPARVVVGADMASCAHGVCKGSSIISWIQVEGDDGQWVDLDVTPQYANPIAPTVVTQKYPKNGTEVTPKNATVVSPTQDQVGNRGAKNALDNTGPDLAVLWATLRGTGIGLLIALILLGPFLAIAGYKIARRGNRRRLADPEQRIAAGWDEYVDVAVDYGYPLLPNPTRTEIAARYESEIGVKLAAIADRAVFGWQEVASTDGDEFWREVDLERRRFTSTATRRERIKAAISLRSLALAVSELSRGRLRAAK